MNGVNDRREEVGGGIPTVVTGTADGDSHPRRRRQFGDEDEQPPQRQASGEQIT
ncbi:hypothetical protein [Stackebrandtia soli]|uniref:hypothetical protein n=1 Tax=Stackebrandtia soli TaxID=1892856 RepID=UPI0039E8EEC1